MRGLRGLLLLGVAEAAALSLLAWWPGPGVPWPGMALYFAAFAAYLGAASRVPDGLEGDRAEGRIRATLLVVGGLAVLFRAVVLPVPPELSDDVFRYLWDGHVQLHGVNPYRYAPADSALADLRTPWHALINSPEVPTIYPPLAQMAFFVVALGGGGVLGAKLLWVALDLAAASMLYFVARESGRNPVRALLLYAWCPLLVLETAWNGHLEPLGIFALALLLLLRSKPRWAGAATAAATLVKFAPAAVLPPLLRRRGIACGVGFALAAAILYAPYVGAGGAIWDGLFTYVRDWRFMVGPFSLLEALLPGRWPPRLAAAALVGGVVAWTTLARFTVERALFWILGAGLLVSPTIHPWYVLWILPFAALRESGPWILLSGLVFLGYWGLTPFLDTGSWPQPVWLRLAVWAPPLVWLGVQLRRDLVPGIRARFAGAGNLTGIRSSAGRSSRKSGEAEGQVARTEEE